MIHAAFSDPVKTEASHPLIILDSGAFSVWRSGRVVNLARYHNYVDTVRSMVIAACNLDVIPGSKGRSATPAEIDDACVQSFMRWKALCKLGVLLMPVYHEGEDINWLYAYLAEGATYVGISPRNSASQMQALSWMLGVHEHMLREGVPLGRSVFTHLLGVFSLKALRELGTLVWSADASTLSQHATRRRLLVPATGKLICASGQFDRMVPTFVGEKSAEPGEQFDVEEVEGYLGDLGVADHFERFDGRLFCDNVHALASANLALAQRIGLTTGVRCFSAGSDTRVNRQIAVESRHPYILISFAQITDRDGSAVRAIYDRDIKLGLTRSASSLRSKSTD